MKLKKPLVVKLSESDKLKAIKRGLSATKFTEFTKLNVKEKIHRSKKAYSRRLKHPAGLDYLEK